MDALILLWLAMLLATDFVDVDPTLLAVCSFENDPIGLTGAAVGVAPAKVVLVSVVEGGFSPKSQYVVTLPLPCVKNTSLDISRHSNDTRAGTRNLVLRKFNNYF